MNSSFGPLYSSTILSCSPSDLVFYLQALIMTTSASLSYSVNANGKGLWVAEVGGRGYDVVVGSHKNSSTVKPVLG